MNARVIPAIGINLARRCKTVLLAQLYYAVRGLLFCCGVLFAFLAFFGAEGVFESLPLELLVDTCFRFCFPRGLTSLLSFKTTFFFHCDDNMKTCCHSVDERNVFHSIRK